MSILLSGALLFAGVPNDDALYQAHLETGVPLAELGAVARCESGPGMDQLIGDNGRARGIFQFHLRTALAWGARVGYVGDVRDDPLASARMAAAKVAEEGTWRSGWWMCAQKLGLR